MPHPLPAPAVLLMCSFAGTCASLPAPTSAGTLAAARPASAPRMSEADYQRARDQFGAAYKLDKAICDDQHDNARDICVEQARAKERVGKAELQYQFTRKPSDATLVLLTQAETAYAIAREKCDDHAGPARDACLQEARSDEARLLAEAERRRKARRHRPDAASAAPGAALLPAGWP